MPSVDRVAYRPSDPLRAWRGPRRALLSSLALGATSPSLVDGYAVRVVAEFQAFARDLHDAAAAAVVRLADADPRHRDALIGAVTSARRLDRGNPTLDVVAKDFARLGILGVLDHLARSVPGWPSARTDLVRLLAFRNAVAHGNSRDRAKALADGAYATVAWVGHCVTHLDLVATALDYLTWENLTRTYRREPW